MRKIVTLISIALSLLTYSLKAQDTTVMHTADFQTHGQSLWGPGTSGFINIDYTFFNTGWNTGGNWGSISNVAGYSFGGSLGVSTWGDIGAGLKISVGNEKVKVDYRTDVALIMPKSNTFNKGQEVTIKTSFTPDPSPDSCKITYDKYNFLFRLWLKLGLGLHLNGQLCVFSCANIPSLNAELPTDTHNIVSISNTHIEFLDGYYEPSELITEWNTTGQLVFSDENEIITLTLKLPSNDSVQTNYLSGKTLKCKSIPFEYGTIDFNINNFVANLHIPYVSTFFEYLTHTWNVGPLNIWYTIMQSDFFLRLYHNQVLTFNPTMYTQMKFPTAVDYKILNPLNNNSIVAQGSDSVVSCKVGNNVKFRYPCNYDFMDISSKYSITNQFTNHTYDSLAFNFGLQMLAFGINMPDIVVIPYFCVDIPYPCPTWSHPFRWCSEEVCTPALIFSGFDYHWGPLVDEEYNLFHLSYDWMNSTWSLGGFNTVDVPSPFRLRPRTFSVATTATPIPCFGQNNGIVTATVTNGTPPYTYEWSNGTVQNTFINPYQFTNLGPGTQYVIVTDVNGCTTFTDAFIDQPLAALSATANVINVDCHGNSTGSIDLTPAGGTAPYTYLWNGGQTTQDRLAVPAGNYNVTIKDIHTCTTIQSYTVQEPAALVVTTDSADVNCYGDASGSASVSVIGGVVPYHYNWSTSGNLPAIINIPAGNYLVTVTDFNNCANVQSIEVHQPLLPVSLNITTQDALCYGESTGFIHIIPSGGTGPYTSLWFNPSGQILNQNATSLDSLLSGVYNAVITDIKGCSIDTSISIQQPAPVTWNFNITDNLCFGESNGSIDITVSGGIAPYIYLWSNGSTTADLSNLPAGNYSVTITDSNGCSHYTTVMVLQPGAPVTASVVPADVLCFGHPSGQADLSPAGGTPPYTYHWSNGYTGEDLSGVLAGAYTVTVTDTNGCIAYSGTVISQPDDSLSMLLNVINPSCNGFGDGSISVQPTGGTKPYYLRWDDNDFLISSSGHLLSDLPAGIYQLIVTDINGCQAIQSITLTAPPEIILEATSTVVSCFEGSDGSVDLTVTGGTLPYNFTWSSGVVSEDLSGLFAGSYTVTVTDAHGCTAMLISQVNSMPELIISSSVVPISCIDNTDGSISVIASGGIGNIMYHWADGSTGNSLQNLTAGNYSITVTDSLGCTRHFDFTVPSSMQECIFIPSSFTPNDDAINDTWIIRNIGLYPENIVKIFNRWGNLLFEGSPYNEPWTGNYKGDPVPSETYYYIIDLNNGTKAFTGTVTIIR